mmetsp:Transcript_57849/g.159701  ORF Transcript_57849/g.159701 Transcript_57849/m.159701 type:complete len:145 (-) Transcript_57849:160-594(-)
MGRLTAHKGSVPLHMQFFLHRHGEWLMLMLGECILSLLLVTEHVSDVNRNNRIAFYMTFLPALLTANCLQFSGYAYEVWTTDDHVMHQSLGGGAIWIILRVIYYGSTLATGVGLRVSLKNYDQEPDVEYAWLLFGAQVKAVLYT